MKKSIVNILSLTLALLLLSALALPALADDDDNRLLTVEGSATVSLTADIATLSVGVYTKDKNVASAQSENARLMDSVYEAVLAMNIDKKDIITSRFTVNSYTDTAPITKVETTYYTVNNTLSVTIRSLENVGKLIDACMAAGANQINSLEFSSTAQKEGYEKALTRAVEDATNKANIIASAAGKQITGIRTITSYGGASAYKTRSYGISNYLATADSAAYDTTIATGDISVDASVTMVFSFK